jgi:hypothetical protein
MKTLTILLIGCCLALAGVTMAQQPEEQQTPKEKHAAEKGRGRAAEAQPGANAAKPEATPAKQRGAKTERAGARGQKAEMTPKTEKATGAEKNATGEPTASATPSTKQHAGQRRKGMKETGANAKTSPAATPATAASPNATPVTAATPATAATASAAPTAATGQQNVGANARGAARKPDPQKVQQIKAQHANFRAQPRPDKVPAVTFNPSYRIEGSDRWQGPQYEVFRAYHPERHDQGWYRAHFTRIELIGGGYYYWNNGYWYPAWGYNPGAEYYAFDGPIYVGHRAEPPDQVIADVQAELKDMGYYQGEVDGLLGPLTRQALAAYQADNGLATTAAIDEPTLDSLELG